MNFLGIALLLIGIGWTAGLWLMHSRAVNKAKAAEAWPTAVGAIERCEVVAEESEDREGGTTTWYQPTVQYRYSVGGSELTGNRLRFGNVRSTTRRKAEAALQPYPAGGPATVRYNPQDPAECVLETTRPGPIYLVMAFFGLIFIGLGIFALVAG